MNGFSEHMHVALGHMAAFPVWERDRRGDWTPAARPGPVVSRSTMANLVKRGAARPTKRNTLGAPVEAAPVQGFHPPPRDLDRCGHCHRPGSACHGFAPACSDAPLGMCRADHYPATPGGV